ncbi:MAG: universal stress protein [Vicinamibacterales bacterium]
MTVTSILCPVDFSAHAERALRYASALASLTGAHLTVLTVTEPLLDAAARASGDHEKLHAQTQEALAALLARHAPAGHGTEPPAVAVVVGDPADAILAQAAECDADVVVMGTQGLGGARKLLFGSTTERVLRRAAIPVLAVPEGADRIEAGPGGPRLSIERLLVPVDVVGPPPTHLETAGAWARLLGAAARLLYVSPAFAAPAPWQVELGPVLDARRAEAAAALDALRARLGPDVPVECEVRAGKPSEQIAEAATAAGCGLIVLAPGRADRRPGATAYRVLCGADVPVLVAAGPA